MPERTDTDAIAELALKPVVESFGSTSDLVIAPPGWTSRVHSYETAQLSPNRSRGVIEVHDAKSFAGAVTHRATNAPPVVYVDDSTNALTAVLNDDAGPTQSGWRDYCVVLGLRPTPEWAHWRARDGQLMNQRAFAEHLENGLLELKEPAAADMLEIAQTFHATASAQFKGGTRLASGARQFRYEEAIEASAGPAGTIEIPERLKLVVVPFYGSARYEVGAWFRFRLTKDDLTLGYKLERPHDIERAAFGDIVAEAQGLLGDVLFIKGRRPAAAEANSEA